MSHPNQGCLSTVNPDPILDALNRGESLRHVAAQLGVSNVGLRAWLLRETGERYHEVITAALTQRVGDADELLEDAKDAVSIARAREIARFARMDLERRRPHLYGQRTQVQVDAKLTIDAALIGRVIDLMPDQDQARLLPLPESEAE